MLGQLLLHVLDRLVPDWNRRPAPDSLQLSVDAWIATKARGQGPDPLAGTSLDSGRVGQVLLFEVSGAGPGPTPQDAVARVQAQIAVEAGRLEPESGPGLHLGLFD